MMLLLSEVEILVDNHLLLLVEFEMLTLSDCSADKEALLLAASEYSPL